MSANLDLVCSIYAAEERGDFSHLGADWWHPEIEHVTVEGPDAGCVTGRSGLINAVRNWLSDFDDVRLQAEDYRELDGDRVLVLNKFTGRAKRSGLQMDGKAAEVFEIHDGRVTRIVQYFDRDRALADLGLAREETALTPAEMLALGRRSYAAFSAGPDIEALLPLYHPDCEWRMAWQGAAVGTDIFRGHDGLRAYVALIDEGWESFAVEIDEARVTSEGVSLVRGHAHGRSRGTHMEVSMPRFWQRGTYRDGLIFSVEQFDEPPPEWDEATPIT